ALVRMVEEAPVAELHRHHLLLGEVVAHAIPMLALLAGRDLLRPRPGVGLRFEQPVFHVRTFMFRPAAAVLSALPLPRAPASVRQGWLRRWPRAASRRRAPPPWRPAPAR